MSIHHVSPKRIMILIILALLITAALSNGHSSGQSATCIDYGQIGEEFGFLRFPSSQFLSGRPNWYFDSSCQSVGGRVRVPRSGWALASNASRAAGVCRANLKGKIEVSADRNSFTSGIWICRVTSTFKPTPYVPSGVILNNSDLRLSAADGFHSGIEFQRLGAGGVGIDSVIARGLLDAVDVWGDIGTGYQVCFPQPGATVFLDAADAPRSVHDIDHSYADGHTCVSHDRAGTIVLVAASLSATPDGAPVNEITLTMPILEPDDSESVLLAGCQITALDNLHFRVSPASGSLGLMPAGLALPATARTRHWFAVAYNGRDGWLNAEQVEALGDCDYPADLTAAAVTATATATQVPSDPASDAELSLENCQITALENMHFRVSPVEGSFGLMPAGLTLPATARTRHWFAVTFLGRDGWLSAEYVSTEGDCEYPSD